MMKTTSAAKISLAALAALGGVTGFVHDVRAAVVISEVYGGGGSTATTGSYNTDFIELYNNGTTAVDLTGLTVRYASSSATVFTFTGTSNVATLTGSLASMSYYLIAGQTASTYGGPALPTANASSSISASATAGAIGLFSAGATDATGLLDLLGYGTAKMYEGTSTAALSTTTSAARTAASLLVDTNINNVDFLVGAPTPQGSAVPEPATLGLAAVGSALVLRRRR